MKYYIAETNANGYVLNNKLWKEINAKDIAQAKRLAVEGQMFQGTALHIAVKNYANDFITVCIKRPDKKLWTNVINNPNDYL